MTTTAACCDRLKTAGLKKFHRPANSAPGKRDEKHQGEVDQSPDDVEEFHRTQRRATVTDERQRDVPIGRSVAQGILRPHGFAERINPRSCPSPRGRRRWSGLMMWTPPPRLAKAMRPSRVVAATPF